jgi:Na+-translocating ferredoxin:NAD+ oxidoreductase RnfA subunit
MMAWPESREVLYNGLWKQNPGIIQLLGLCPLLAISNTVVNALALGLATTLVMAIASGSIAVIRNLIPSALRIPVFVLIIAALVTVITLIIQAYAQPLYLVLGIFLPLITTNCAVLGAAELSVKAGHSVIEATIFGTCSAIGFALALVLFSSLRERLDLAKVPAPFQGTAIALITAGILAMVFMGFSGLV